MPNQNPRVPDAVAPAGLSASMDDVLRSLRRWLGVLLPEPWDLRYQRSDTMERPSGLVVPATPLVSSGTAYVRDNARSFDAFLYPPGYEGDPARSRWEAETLADQVRRAWVAGLRLSDGSYYSRSMRLPVFDHAGVPYDQDVPADAEPFDHLPVSGLGVEPRIDPDDDTLFSVVLSLRVSWTEDGDVSRLEGTLLQDVRYGFRAS